MNTDIIVSIVIPAYKVQHLEKALDSVFAQTFQNLELVICDDSADGRIAELVEQKKIGACLPILYIKNRQRIGELTNTVKGIRHAQGKYIKFLHDDDVLEPECVAELVAAMEREPGVALASSRRQRIDEQGEPISDILATCFPFTGDVIIDGPELISFLGDHTINFIGEPSCIMARRVDLQEIDMQLMSLNGKVIHWVGDLALYAKLLQLGNLAFLSKPLTKFRVSTQQFSQLGRDRPGIGAQGHADFRQAVRDLGWYRTSGDNRFVRVAPITQLKARVFKPLNLLESIYRAEGYGSVSLSTWLQARRPSEAQQRLIDQRLASYAGGPQVAVILVDEQGDDAALERSLASLASTSLYQKVTVVALRPADSPSATSGCHCVELLSTGVAATLNGALDEVVADWFVVAKVGVEFTPSGLLICALDLLEAPDECLAIYADEVIRLDDDGYGLALRPDLNLDMLLSFPAGLSRHWLFRRQALLARNGFVGPTFELEYQLRLIHELGIGCIGHVAEPLLISSAQRLEDEPAERQVIEQHLQARGYHQAQVGTRLAGRYELDYAHARQASVSILVEVKGSLAAVQRCVDSVLEHTIQTPYELLLLQGVDDPDVMGWLSAVEHMGAEQIRVIRAQPGLSRTACRNQAAMQACGDFLLWLDDSAGVLSADWLPQLFNHALRPEVGAVSGKLLAADGKVQHGGLVLGLCGPVGRMFEGLSHDDAGYMQRLQIDQNHSALAGECLMLRRELFVEAGGFDESAELTRWAEVDLCLRLQQAGYLNVWTPRVALLVDMPAQPVEPSEADADALYARWLPRLARDPAYNPGFSLVQPGGFKLADPGLAWRPLESWRPLPRVLAHPADLFGCGHYRIVQPFKALEDAGLVEGAMSTSLLPLTELERFQPDVILLQRQVGAERLAAMQRMKAFSSAFKVYELDDYLPNLPLKNAHRQHMPKDILRSLRQGFACVDRLVVSTEALAEAFVGMHERIRIVHNRLPSHWWGNLQSCRRTSARPRVGWAGGAGHSGDLEMIVDVVKELASEVDWVFFGMCPEVIRPFVKEFHSGVDITRYPQALAALNLDLALAPVEQNLFNECKSNLRLLEYGACGIPVICSDVRCYQDGLPVMRVKNRFRDWVDAIRMHITDLDACAQAGDALRSAVHCDWMLEGPGLQTWRTAWLPD